MESPISDIPGYITFLGSVSDKMIDDNKWHHIAGIYDNDLGMAYLFVDGVLNDSIAISDDFLSIIENETDIIK